MVLPGNYDRVTVRGTYVGLDGTPIQGTVSFTPRASRLVDQAALVTIIGRKISAGLDSNGHFEIQLPATDDPDISGSGFTYMVTESFSGAIPPYDIEVPLSALADGIDLINQAHLPASTGTFGSPVTQAELNTILDVMNGKIDASEIGQPNGVASLDADGFVPDSQMPVYLEQSTLDATYLRSGSYVLSFDTDGVPYVGAAEAGGSNVATFMLDSDGNPYFLVGGS